MRVSKGVAGVSVIAGLLTVIARGAFQTAGRDLAAPGMPAVCIGGAVVLGVAVLTLILKRRETLMTWISRLLLILLPGLLYLLVEIATGHLASIRPPFLQINLLVLLLAVGLFSLPFRQIRIGTILLTALLLALALGEHYVLVFRGRSLALLDLLNFATAAQVADSYQFEISAQTALALELFLLLLWLQAACLRIEWPKRPHGRLIRWTALGIAAAAIVLGAQPEEAVYGPWQATLSDEADGDLRIGEFDFQNFESNYARKGLLWSLCLQTRFLRVPVPEGYSPERVQAIAEASEGHYVDEVPRSPVTRPNIILIMNESLVNMSWLGEVKTERELLPCISHLEGNVIKGYLQVPVFGGGTSETEYEALTGNSKQFLAAFSTAYASDCRKPEYSLASTLRQQGYRTVALHPHAAANYHRDTVYPAMGFDAFISLEGWSDDQPVIRRYMTDEGAYREVIRVVEEGGDEPVFAFLVTMQNHGGYSNASRNGYEDRVELAYDQAYPEAELYMALANESDRAFQGLIDYFEQVDAPTMIVLFGDHYPMLETSFYSALLENGADLIQRQKYYQTPYVIWANYDIPEADHQDMSANYLGSAILELAGLETTAYDRFLLSLKKQLPVIGMGMVMDADGEWYSMAELPGPYRALLDDYKLWQYNRVFDRASLPELYMPSRRSLP